MGKNRENLGEGRFDSNLKKAAALGDTGTLDNGLGLHNLIESGAEILLKGVKVVSKAIAGVIKFSGKK